MEVCVISGQSHRHLISRSFAQGATSIQVMEVGPEWIIDRKNWPTWSVTEFKQSKIVHIATKEVVSKVSLQGNGSHQCNRRSHLQLVHSSQSDWTSVPSPKQSQVKGSVTRVLEPTTIKPYRVTEGGNYFDPYLSK